MATAKETPAITPGQDHEILAHLFEARGDEAARDLAGSIAQAIQRAEYMASSFADGRRRGVPFQVPFHQVVTGVLAHVANARTLRARLATLAGLGSAPAAELAAGFPGGSAEAEAHGILLAAAGQFYPDASRRYLADGEAGLAERLAGYAPQIDSLKRGHAAHTRYHDPNGCPHSAVYGLISVQVSARDAAEALLSDLRALRADAARIQGARVAGAVESGGGTQRVAGGVREAWMIAGRYWESDPSAGEVARKAAALAELDAQIGRLGPGGSLAEALSGDRKAAAAELESARSGADGRLRSGIAALLARAVAGEEPPRAEIEAAARAAPRAFKADLARSLMEAQFEWSDEGPRVVAMIARVSAG